MRPTTPLPLPLVGELWLWFDRELFVILSEQFIKEYDDGHKSIPSHKAFCLTTPELTEIAIVKENVHRWKRVA